MTQWLVEEAAFAALELSEAMAERQALEERSDGARLQRRAEELRAMAARQVKGR